MKPIEGSNWNKLYKVGGIAALVIVLIIPIQIIIFTFISSARHYDRVFELTQQPVYRTVEPGSFILHKQRSFNIGISWIVCCTKRNGSYKYAYSRNNRIYRDSRILCFGCRI